MTLAPYYDDGKGIVIYHGDSREIVPHLAFDCVLTDPPYGVQYRQPWKTKGRMAIQGDDAWRFTRPTVPFVVWGANNSPDYPDAGWLVWDKKRYGADLFGDGELAATDRFKGVRIFPSAWNREARHGWTGAHPTEKPPVLMEWCLSFLPPGTVLDQFSGGGLRLSRRRISGGARSASRSRSGIVRSPRNGCRRRCCRCDPATVDKGHKSTYLSGCEVSPGGEHFRGCCRSSGSSGKLGGPLCVSGWRRSFADDGL